MHDRLTCPICGGRLPEPSKRGRPRIFCCSTCRARARTRVHQAVKLLELADIVEGNIGKPAFGSEDYLRRRAAGLREDAAGLVRGIPDALWVPGARLNLTGSSAIGRESGDCR